MAAPILAGLIQNATSAGGTTSKGTPNVSPGLDPGRYAFELWFGKQRREEEAAEKEREMQEQIREFDISAGIKNREQNTIGIGMLAEQRAGADANSKLRSFRQMLAKSYTA